MGLQIFTTKTKHRRGSFPRPIALVLTCDMPIHSRGGLFDDRTPEQMFKSPPCNGYPGMSSAAIQAGWRETRKLGARAFVCPGCNGIVSPVVRRAVVVIDNEGD